MWSKHTSDDFFATLVALHFTPGDDYDDYFLWSNYIGDDYDDYFCLVQAH